MLNLDHQNPSAVRRDENASNIANHIKKEEQLRQKLDLERASKRELVERLHAEKEEIKHKSKLVVDMFKQKIAETESQLISSKNYLDHVSHRSSLTGELLRDHIAKWKLWNESLQCCDNMEVFAEYLLNQPMRFISASDSTAAVGVSAPSEIPSLMITELDQILSFITNMDLEVQLDNIPYFTLVPVVDTVQAKATRPREGSSSNMTIKTSSQDAATKLGMSPLRRPLSSLDTNTGAFSASSSPLQSPVTARVPRPLSSRGTSSKRSSGIGMPGSPSFSFFEDDSPEPVCLVCAASTASVAESRELVTELAARLKVSEEQFITQEQRCSTLTSTLSATQGDLAKAEEKFEDLEGQRDQLQSQLTTEQDRRARFEQQISVLEEEHTTLNNVLTIERAARVQAEQQVESLGLAVQKLESKVVRLKGALEKSKQETSDVRETLQRERDTHSNLLLRHTIELEAAALAATQRAGEFNAQLEVFKALAAGPTATIAALEVDLKMKDTELKEASSRLAQQLETMTASEAALRTLLEESQRRGEEEKCAGVAAQEALRAELRGMEEVCHQLDSFAQRRNDEAIDLAVQLQAAKDLHTVDLNTLSALLMESSAALEVSREEVLKRNSEVCVLSDRLAGRVQVISELEGKIEGKEFARAALHEKLNGSKTSLQASSDRVAALEALVSELQSRLEESVRLAQQEASESVAEFSRRYTEERQEAGHALEMAQVEHAVAVQHLQEQLAQEIHHVEELTSQLQARDAEVQLLSTTLMSQSEVKNLLAVAKLEADAQTSELEELEELKRRFAEQTEEVAVKRSAMVARIALLTEDLQSREATIVSLTSASEVARVETSAQIESLSAKLSAAEESVVHLTQEVNSLSEESTSLRATHGCDVESLRQIQVVCAQLKDQLTALEASAQVEKSTSAEHIADLEQQYSEVCDVKGRLEEELEGVRTRAADAGTLEIELQSASARCRELEEKVEEHAIRTASLEAQSLVWQSTVAEQDQLHVTSTSETAELSRQLQQSVLRVQTLESTLSECEGELELFKECNDRVSAERDEAQEKLETATAALEETQSELALLHSRARSLEEECAQLRIQVQDQVAEHTHLVALHEEKMSKLQQRLIDAEQETKQSAAEAEVLRNKLRECESAIAEANSTLAKRNMELDVIQQSLRETERLKDATEVKFTELEESYLRVVGKLEVRIADLVIERDTLRENASELRAQSESTGSSLSDSNAVVAELQQAAVAYHEEIETLTAKLSSQREAMDAVCADLDAQAQALTDLETQLSEQFKFMEEEKKSMTRSLQAQQAAFTNALAELQHKSDHAVSSLRSNLLASLALEQNEVKDLVAKLTAREAQYEILSTQLEDLARREEDVRSERDRLVTFNDQLHQRVADAQVELESAKTRMVELDRSVTERDQELEQLQATIESLQAEITCAREQAVEREESIYGLQLCVQATEQDRIALQKTFNATTAAHMSAVSEAAERLGAIAQERDAVQADRDALAVTLAGLKIEVDSLSAELALAQATVAEMETKAQAVTLSHASEVAEFSSHLDASAAAVTELESRLREFEASGASSSEQLRLTLEQRDYLRAELTTAKESLSDLVGEHSALCARHEELTSSANHTQHAVDEAYVVIATTEALLREATELAEVRRLESASLSVQIIYLQSSVESLTNYVSVRDTTIQDIEGRLLERNAELSALKEALSAEAAQLSTELSASVLQVEQLQSQIVQHVAAADIISSELCALKFAHDQLVSSAEGAAVSHSRVVIDLSAQIEALEHEMSERKCELEAVLQERNDLRGIRGSLTVQVMNLQGAISTLQASSTAQQASLELRGQDLACKTAELLQAETLLQDAQDKCGALSAELAAEEEEVAGLVAEIAESKAALLSSEGAIAELSQSLADHKHELGELSSSTSAQIAALESDLAAASRTSAALEAKVEEFTAQVQGLEGARLALQADAQTAEETHLGIVSELVSRTEKLETRLQDIEALGASSSEQLRLTLEQRDALQSECESVSAELGSVRQTVTDLESAVEKKAAAHAEILAELIARLEELASVRADLEHQDNIHREAMVATESERVQWKLLSAQRDLALCKVIKDLSRANLECTSLSVELAASQDAELALLSQASQFKQRALRSEAALRELDECAVERTRELDSLAASSAGNIAQLEMSLQSMREQLQAVKGDLNLARAASISTAVNHAAALEEVHARVHQFETTGASSSEQLRLTLAQRDTLQDKQVELLANITALEADVACAQQLVASVEQEMADVRAEFKEQLRVSEEQREVLQSDLINWRETCTSHEARLSDLQFALAAQSTEHDEVVVALQRDIGEHAQSLLETAAELQCAEKMCKALKHQCIIISSEVKALNENEVHLLRSIEILEHRARVAESAVRDLDNCVVACNADFDHLRETSNATETALTAEAVLAQVQITALNEQVQRLTAALLDATQMASDAKVASSAAIDTMSQRLQVLTEERDELHVTCNELQVCKATLEEGLRTLQSDFNLGELAHTELVTQLSADIARHSDHIKDQQNTIDQLQTELESSHQNLSILQSSAEEQTRQHAAVVSDFKTHIEALQVDHSAGVAALESRLREFEAAGASSSEQLRLTLQRRDELQAECETLTQSVADQNTELASLHQQYSETASRHQEEVSTLRVTLEEVRAECVELQSALEQSNLDAERSSSELFDAHAAAHCLQIERDALLLDLSSKSQESEAFALEISSLGASLSAAEEKFRVGEASICDLESAALAAAEKIAALEADLNSAVQESASLSMALEARDAEIAARTLHYHVLSRQLIEHIDRVDEYESELVALQHEVYRTEASVVCLRAKLYAAESAIRDLDHDCLEKNSVVETLSVTSSAAIAEAVAQAHTALETVARLEALVAEREDIIQKLVIGQTDLESSLQFNLTSHEEAMDTQRELLTATEQRNADTVQLLESRLREFEALGASSSEQLRLTLQQRDALQAERDSLLQDIDRLEGQLSSVQRDLTQSINLHAEEKALMDAEIDQKAARLKELELAVADLQLSLSSAKQSVVEAKVSADAAALTAEKLLHEAETKYKTLVIELGAAQDSLSTTSEELATLTANSQQQSRDHSAAVASMRSELEQRSACLKQISQALAGAEERMEQTSAEMKTYESLLTSAQTQLTNCTDEINRLKSALAEAESAKAYLDESMALSRAENADVEDQRCAAELRCSSLESNLLDVEKNLRMALKESVVLSAQLAEQTTHIDTLTKAAQDNEESLLAQNAQLCGDIAVAQEELRRVAELCVEKESQLEDLHVQCETRGARVAELEAAVESLSEAIAANQVQLEHTNEQLEANKTAFDAERDEMQAQLSALDATVVDLQSTIAGLQSQLQSAVSESATLTEQLSTDRATHAAVEEEFASQISALSAELEDRVAQLETLESQVRALSGQCETDSARISELNGIVQTLTDSIRATQVELETTTCAAQSAQAQLQADEDELRAQINSLDATVQGLNANIAELQDQLASASAEAAAHINTIENLSGQLSRDREQHAAAEQELTSQITALSAELHEKAVELDALEAQLSEVSAECEVCSVRIAELTGSIQCLTESIETTGAERDELSVQIVSLKSSEACLQSATAELEIQLTAASAQSIAHTEIIAQLEADRDARVALEQQLTSRVTTLSGELTAVQEELRATNAESQMRDTRCQALEAQLCELDAQIQACDTRIIELEATVTSLTERLTTTEAELMESQLDLENTKASFSGEREELNLLVDGLRETVAQLEAQLFSASEDSVTHIETIDHLSELLAASRAACTTAEEAVAQLSNLNTDLRTSVADRENCVAELETQLTTLQAANDAQAAELSTTALQLQKEQKKAQNLLKKLQQSEEKVRVQEKLVEEKSAALAEMKDELSRSEKQIDVLMADATSAAVLLRTVQTDLAQEKDLHAACSVSEGRANAHIVELQDHIGQLQGQLAITTDASAAQSEKIRQLSEDLAASQDANATADEIIAKLSVLNRDLACTTEELRARLEEVQATTAVQISAMEISVAQLESQLADTIAQCDQEKQSVQELSEKLHEETNAARVLKQQLHEAGVGLAEIQNELTHACTEIESLRTDAIATTAHGHNLEQLLAESQASRAAGVAALEVLRAEFAALQTVANERAEELAVTKATIERLNRNITVSASVVASLEKQLLIAQDELEESQESTRQLSVELEKVKEEVGLQSLEVQDKSALVLSLEQQLHTRAEESAASESRLRDASAEVIADLQAQIQDLSAHLAAAAGSAQQQRQLSVLREGELDAIQQDLLSVREGLASALATAEEEQSAHELESLNLNGKIAEKEFAIRELTSEIESLTEEVRHHREEVTLANAQVQALEQHVLVLSDKKANLEVRLLQLQTEHSHALASLSESESASSSNSAKLQLDQASLHALATELVEVKAAFQHCQGQLREHKSSAITLKAEIARKTESFLLLEHRLAEKVSAESALLSELETFQQLESTLKAELKRSQADVAALTARLNESVAEMSHSQDAHTNELFLLRQNIQQRELVLQELNDRLLEQMEQSDELKRQMQDATAASNKMNRDLRERNTELEELHVEHGVLGAQEHIHSKEISDLKAQLHTAETALANLKQELHVRTLESADLAVSMKQRQGGIQQLTVTLTDKDKKIQQLHTEMTAVRTKLHAAEEKSAKLDIQVKSLTNVVHDLRVLQASQEKVLEQERGVWAVDSADLIARIQENEFIIQELNDRIVENEKVIAGYESSVQETQSERQHLESQFFNIRDQLQANLAQCAELKLNASPVSIPITSTIPLDGSGEFTEKLLQQKDDELKAQAASWSSKFEDLEVHTNQRVESIREALATQFEAQTAAQHIESHMLEDKVATLEGLLAASQHELQQYHESHPEPAEGAMVAQDSEEVRALQAGVVRMKAKVASKSKQILLLNQQMLRDRQNFHKLKKSLVKLDELKAMVFANNFNPAVPAPPLPPNQVSELFHLGMEEATKKIEKKQQVLLAQQQEEFQVIRDNLENTLSSLEHQAPTILTTDSVNTLSETIHALHGELRDQAAAHHESQRQVQEMRERSSAKEAAHYLALSEKTVECNALRATLQNLEQKYGSAERTVEMDADVVSLQEQLRRAQVELQVMAQRQAEGSQKFQRAVHTIKVLEARGDSLKEECAAANAEILKLFQKAGSRMK